MNSMYEEERFLKGGKSVRPVYNLQWASKDLGQETRIALGDVNADGSLEIVAGTCAAVSGGSNLYVFKYTGKTYHQLARESLGNHDTKCIRVFDIDRDGIDEIIIGSNRAILIYKMRGNRLVKIAEATVGGTVVSLTAADIDGDRCPEIVAAVSGKSTIYIFRFDGSLTLVKQEAFRSNVACVSTGDVDGDGCHELVVKTYGSDGCFISVISYSKGIKREKMRCRVASGGREFLVVKDMNRDGKAEIITDCTDRKVRIYGVLGTDCKVVWESPTLDKPPRDVDAYDVDNDGDIELVIVSLDTVYIYGWQNRRIILEWTQTIPNGVICVAIGELDKRNYGEIVLGTVYGYIYVMEARRDKDRGKLWVGKVQALIQDTVEIPPGKPDAAKGVEAQARFSIDEVKVLCDKVIVDGDVTAKILYVAAIPSQPVHFFQATFPFLEFIHLHGADPGMEALVFFNVEHVNVSVVGPRKIKVTILFEMLVKLVKPYWDPCWDC